MKGIMSYSSVEESSSSDSTSVVAMKLASSSAVVMALRFALELNLLQLITNSASASASELAAQLPANNRPQAAAMIDRILRLLAANSILTATAGAEWRYSLTPLGEFFTTNENGVSLAPFSLLIQDKVFMDTWYHLKDAAMEGGVAFDRAHGMNAFEYPATDPRFSKVFNEAMCAQSTIFMTRILQKYKGFEGVESLVDVDGGTAVSLTMILAKHPSIKGKAINFDLPHVICDAPSLPGVEHIGGDMFVSVPKADAIFMKWICHDWSDQHCEKLLKNCYEALPANGKLIVAESILPDDPKEEVLGESLAVLQMDVLMLAFNPGGKERTEMEFHALATKSGFKRFLKVCCACDIWIMEFHK